MLVAWTSYTYNSNGGGNRLLAVTDAAGHRTGYQYDDYGRLVAEVLYAGTAEGAYVAAESTGYAYDVMGRTAQVTQPSGYVSSTMYDAQGRVAETAVWATEGEYKDFPHGRKRKVSE